MFLLELDNGFKATARIPGLVVGNLELATASEVATMSYLHDLNAAGVPRVLAWNAATTESNEVNWPYIVTEYIPRFSPAYQLAEYSRDSSSKSYCSHGVNISSLLEVSLCSNRKLVLQRRRER